MKLITFFRRIGDLVVAIWNGGFAVSRDGVVNVKTDVVIAGRETQ